MVESLPKKIGYRTFIFRESLHAIKGDTMNSLKAGLLIVILAMASPRDAFALITGGAGNQPVSDPGWPKGAAGIFNHSGRISWWEGPPFGGGQWHAECRGDAKTLSAVLAGFAKIDVKSKRIVVHDGAGHSFWLAPNNEPEKLAAAKIDWVFMVWQPANWEHLHKMPADFNPTDPADTGAPSQIDVFTGELHWSEVTVPGGVEVIDQRLVAHGFSAADGVVIEGKVSDLSTRQPIAASMRLAARRAADQGRLSLPGRRGDEVRRTRPMGPETDTGGLVARRRRGGRLRTARSRLCPVRRAAQVAVLRLWTFTIRARRGARYRRRW